jgi:tellurite resistance protein
LQGLIERIRGMSVTWFSFNLATSAIAISTFALGSLEHYHAMISLARILAYINTGTFIFAITLYTLKILMDLRRFIQELRHPLRGPFISTASIATMLLSLDWMLILGSKLMGALFFYAGLAIHTFIFLVVTYSLERHPGIEVHYMNPGWYMPAVGNVLIPYVGMLLAGRGVPVSKSLLGIYLGTGTVMWLVLFAIWLYRAVFYSPPPARLMATTWINLAPPSIIPLSYEALLGFTPDVYARLYQQAAATPGGALTVKLLVSIYDFFYYTFWGVAGMLFALVVMITLAYLRRGEVEFAESWWAFVFPLAAYSISTIHLYSHHPEDHWLLYYIWLLYIMAWAAYAITTALSLIYEYEELVKGIPVERLPEPLRPLHEELVRASRRLRSTNGRGETP